MVIIRNEERIEKLKRVSQWTSLVGLLILIVGLSFLFLPVESPFLYQTLALVGGWILSQIGLYLAHRYVRSPRPDEVLDKAVKNFSRQTRLYHYVLPIPHLLLTPEGPIVFNLKFQTGRISVEGDRWQQKGLGLRRFFSQESLGNPTKEAETMVKGLAKFISQNAPEIEEVPIGAIIVFTSPEANKEDLDLENSTIPAVHHSQLAQFLKKNKKKGAPLPPEQYEQLQTIFDEAAGDSLPE